MGPSDLMFCSEYITASITPTDDPAPGKTSRDMGKGSSQSGLPGLRYFPVHVLCSIDDQLAREEGAVSDYDLVGLLAERHGGDLLDNALATMEMRQRKSMKSRDGGIDLANVGEPRNGPTPYTGTEIAKRRNLIASGPANPTGADVIMGRVFPYRFPERCDGFNHPTWARCPLRRGYDTGFP